MTARFPRREQGGGGRWWIPVLIGAASVLALGATSGLGYAQRGFGLRQEPAPVFSNPTNITNPILPLSSLTQDILEGTEEGEKVRVERTRKEGTKTFTINGKTVAALIVEDREFVDGEIHEVAQDYFAQADDGTVYYLGEDVDDYENGQIVGHGGAWLYGVHTNKLGVVMPANPKVGSRFTPENVPEITREDARVVAVGETVTVPAGTFAGCLKVREIHDNDEIEFKYFAPGVGVVKEVPEDGEVNLISHR
jgi:hypothetical protein